MKIRVLHITEALNGGIYSIFESLSRDSDYIEHTLYWSCHPDTPIPNTTNLENGNFHSFQLPAKKYKKYISIFRLSRSKNFDVIHLHSSRSGFFGRILPSPSPIVYSAHGYSFQKLDINRLFRAFFFLIESVLQVNTTAHFNWWPVEEKYAMTIKPKRRSLNCSLMVMAPFKRKDDAKLELQIKKRNQVVIVGRVTSAKDPKFAIEMFKILVELDPSINLIWVGGGDQILIDELESAGIYVTGWVSKEEVISFMKNSYSLIITSAWEAGPATLYEALSLDLPIAARSIPSTQVLGFNTFSTPKDLAIEVQLLKNPSYSLERYNQQFESTYSALEAGQFRNMVDLYSEIVKWGEIGA